MGMMGNASQIVLQIWSEPLQKFRLAAEGHGAKQPPENLRERVRTYCDPLPFWYAPLEQQQHDTEPYPLLGRHAAADGDVPFLGVDECLAAADPWVEQAVHVARTRHRPKASPRMTGCGWKAAAGG